MATVGLMPAAGYATRLGPIADSKEVLPVRGRPVMTYLVERFRLADVDEIRVSTRLEKTDVIELARSWGATVVTGRPEHVSESLRLAATGLRDDDVVLFGFPDTIWSPADGYRPLRALIESGEPLALGVFESPYPARSDVVVLDDDGRVVRVDVKHPEPVSSLVWACGAARTATLRALTEEREPGVAFGRYAAASPIATVKLGRVIDVGTPGAFAEAENDPIFAS
jgi:glucose-1-phosphate thymidylyltransferase